MSDKLKPCPFCGSNGAILHEVTDHNHMIMCDCGASGALAESKKEAIEAWNRRTKDE